VYFLVKVLVEFSKECNEATKKPSNVDIVYYMNVRLRASPMGCWMSHNNGKLASLNENRVPIVSACDFPFSALRHFHCLSRYPVACGCAMIFPQQSWINTDDGGYGSVGGDKGVIGRWTRCRISLYRRTSSFVAPGNSVAFMAKSGMPDLDFG
jgi:hypothetical protein